MPEKSWVDTESPGTWWGGRRIGIIHKADLDSGGGPRGRVSIVRTPRHPPGASPIRTVRQLIALSFVLFFAVPLIAATITVTSVTPGTGEMVVKGKYTLDAGESLKGLGVRTQNKTTKADYIGAKNPKLNPDKTWEITIVCPAGTYNPTTPSITVIVAGKEVGPDDGTPNKDDQVVK